MKKIFLFLFSVSQVLYAQKNWTLEECINYAMTNNLVVIQGKLNKNAAENSLLANKMDLYTPEINFTVSENMNFSNSLDPLTFEFINANTNSTVFNISGNYTIFNGFQRVNAIKAAKAEVDAADFEIEELRNRTKLSVLNAFLQVLLAKEIIDISKNNKNETESQLQRTKELINAGVLAKGDVYDIEAQFANDEYNLTNANNNVNLALNNLKLILQIDPEDEFDIVVPSTFSGEFENPNIPNYGTLKATASQVLPNLRGVELKQKSAEYQLKQAKGSLFPSITFNANVGTNYFSAARQFLGNEFQTTLIGLTQSGEFVEGILPSPIYGDLSFGQQINRNLNERISFNLFVPIFGKWQRMVAIDNARLNILNNQYNWETKNNELKQSVYEALLNVNNAIDKFSAAEKSEKAARMAYNNSNEKLKAGLISTFDFSTIRNRLSTSEANLYQAKYEYIFSKLVLDFYLGKPIKL